MNLKSFVWDSCMWCQWWLNTFHTQTNTYKHKYVQMGRCKHLPLMQNFDSVSPQNGNICDACNCLIFSRIFGFVIFFVCVCIYMNGFSQHGTRLICATFWLLALLLKCFFSRSFFFSAKKLYHIFGAKLHSIKVNYVAFSLFFGVLLLLFFFGAYCLLCIPMWKSLSFANGIRKQRQTIQKADVFCLNCWLTNSTFTLFN